MATGCKQKIKVIDLFAGIGGIGLAFKRAGFDIVYSNDFDGFACKTYKTNVGEIDYRDIRKVKPDELPDYNVLLAGFPCQPFSVLGRRLGFEDPRGNLFFEIERLLHANKPDAFFLENVRHLKAHNGGNTFREISKALEGRLGYKLFFEILNGKDFGLAQSRERFYMVGFRENVKFSFPKAKNKELPRLASILEKNVDPKYYLSEKYLTGLERHKERHRNKGNGFGYEILDLEGIAHTLVAGNMGRERNLIKDEPLKSYDKEILTPRNKKGVRKLTVREYARLQGFPDSFIFPVSDNQAYKQIGNSVCVPAVYAVAKRMKKVLESTYAFQQVQLASELTISEK